MGTGGFYYWKGLSVENTLEWTLGIRNATKLPLGVEINGIKYGHEWSRNEIKILSELESCTVHLPYAPRTPEQHTWCSKTRLSLPKFRHFVVHPEDDLSFDEYNNPWFAFENLDSRSQLFSRPENMAEIFKKSPSAGFVCDVNHVEDHAFCVDKFLTYAAPFWYERIRELHVSSHVAFSEGLHYLPKAVTTHCLYTKGTRNSQEILDFFLKFTPPYVPLAIEGVYPPEDFSAVEEEVLWINDFSSERSPIRKIQEFLATK